MNGPDKISFSWWRRLNARWPWLKIGVVIAVMMLGIVIIKGWAIGRAGLDNLRVPLAMVGVRSEVPQAVLVVKKDLTGKKLVALTFDDGPSTQTTPRLLDVLARRNVQATFFVLGNRAQDNAEIVKREIAEGHEVGSHTMSHQNLARLSAGAVVGEANGAKNVLRQITGKDPVLVRPPYGSVNETVKKNIGGVMVLWSVDTLDWKSRDVGAILTEVKAQTFDGAIILMHDIYASTVDAVGPVIDELRTQGYEFVTVSELAKERGVTLKTGVAYGSFKP